MFATMRRPLASLGRRAILGSLLLVAAAGLVVAAWPAGAAPLPESNLRLTMVSAVNTGAGGAEFQFTVENLGRDNLAANGAVGTPGYSIRISGSPTMFCPTGDHFTCFYYGYAWERVTVGSVLHHTIPVASLRIGQTLTFVLVPHVGAFDPEYEETNIVTYTYR